MSACERYVNLLQLPFSQTRRGVAVVRVRVSLERFILEFVAGEPRQDRGEGL